MALSDIYSFKLGDNGVVLNTDSTNVPFVDIDRVVGLDNAPYRETERDHEGVDGGFLDAEFEKGRSIVLEGTVYTAIGLTETYLDSLKENFAPSRTLVPFYFRLPDVGERVCFVKPQGCRYDWDALRRIGSGSIQFHMFAEDPRLYSATLTTTAILQAAQATTGRGYNKGYNYGYGAAVTPGSTNCINSGNRDTPVQFTVVGPCTNPTIVNLTDSSTLRIMVTLSATDTLFVDTQYHTITVNGSNRRDALVDPDWFYLHKGDNYISFQADSVGPATLNVSYRSAWR